MVTTPVLWRRSVRNLLVPSVVETVGAKVHKSREWRTWIVRQKRAIVGVSKKGLEVAVMLVIISTLG